jgi:hypothetical protein
VSEQQNAPESVGGAQFPDESVESLSLETTEGITVPAEYLRNLKLRLKLHGGTEIEVPLDEINMGSARSRFQREASPTASARFARCGNCLEKLLLSGDAETDHHAAMRHKQVCRVNTELSTFAYNRDQYIQLVREHAAQPMQVEFRRIQALRIAAEERERLKLSAPDPELGEPVTRARGRRWWQFWKMI